MAIDGAGRYQYVPYEELAERRNLIVAGQALPHTICTVSPFFPRFLEKEDLCDTSAGIVGKMKARERFQADSWAVSSDAFSIDGLTGLLALLSDDRSYIKQLEEISRIGLYQYGRDRDLAHSVFVLHAWMDRARSPLNEGVFNLPAAQRANVFYEELIPRFSKIVEKIDRFHGFWQAEEDRLELTETLLERGTINQVEMDGLDLAIFDIDPEQYEEGGVLRGASTFWHDSLHRMALHNATSCTRVLLHSGGRYLLYCRPDSLAVCHQHLLPPPPRLDRIATALNLIEQSSNKDAKPIWAFDPADKLRPTLSTTQAVPSLLSLQEIVDVFSQELTLEED